jgi:4-hydroxy-3-methylbut-2-enyl diphosphate reductase
VLKKFVSDAVDHVKELKVFNTICNSTALRLKETKDIARGVDAVIVVGGKNSANTTQLANFCISISVPTYHIETASEIRNEWFVNVRKVGITAGASTPDWIIEEVTDRIRHIGGR